MCVVYVAVVFYTYVCQSLVQAITRTNAYSENDKYPNEEMAFQELHIR